MGVSLTVKKSGELDIEVLVSDIQIDQVGILIKQVQGQLTGNASTKATVPSELKPPVQIAVPANKPSVPAAAPKPAAAPTGEVIDRTGMRGRHPLNCACPKCQAKRVSAISVQRPAGMTVSAAPASAKPPVVPAKPIAAAPKPTVAKPVAPSAPAVEEPEAAPEMADNAEWDKLQKEIEAQINTASDDQPEEEVAAEEPVMETTEAVEETSEETVEEAPGEEAVAETSEETIAEETPANLPPCYGKHEHPLDTLEWAQKTETGKLKRYATCAACPHEDMCIENSPEEA